MLPIEAVFIYIRRFLFLSVPYYFKFLIMSCMNKNCQYNSYDERMIHCWLCRNLCHVKCAGLSARTADGLNVDKGVRWCCVNCRKVELDFYNFFRSLQSEFSEMEKGFTNLFTRFSEFSKMFKDYPDMDKLAKSPASTPKRKKSNKKSVPGPTLQSQNLIGFESPHPSTSSAVLAAPSICHDKLHGNSAVSKPTVVTVPSFTNSATALEEEPPEIIISQSSTGLTPGSVTIPPPSTEGIPIQESLGPTDMRSVDNVRPTTHVVSLPSTGTRSQPRALTVVPARRAIFVSRFAPDTTVDDIRYFISCKGTTASSIDVFKLKSSYSERRSSFKLIVSVDLFPIMLNSNYWPVGAFVKEFTYDDNRRHNKTARLPARTTPASKN